MSLRPRYSLLTLLILTALVAGGVKLWYGPHHVVEQTEPNWELELTYTRDWRGNRIIDGPVIVRRTAAQPWDMIYVHFFRQGVDTRWVYGGIAKTPYYTLLFNTTAPCPLTQQERQIFNLARDADLKRLEAAGLKCEYQIEGLSSIPFSPPHYQN